MGRLALTLTPMSFIFTAAIFTYVHGMTQEKLDYMATHLQVQYEVLDNLEDSMDTYSCQITITNKGKRPFPGQGWIIYFTQLSLVEPRHYPYPQGLLKADQFVVFKHIQGSLFSVQPAEGFQDMVSEDRRVIRFLSERWSVSRTDSFPHWYLTAPGLEPRTLTSTAGETLQWVGAFDSHNKWKRFDFVLPSQEAHDRYDPYTAFTRYAVNTVQDMGGVQKRVIPTPIEMKMPDATEESYVQLNTKDWVIFASAKFHNEGRMLANRLGISLSKDRVESHVIVFKPHDLWWNVKGQEVGGAEAYTLIVDPVRKVVEIKAHDPPGAFHGAMTLINLMDDEFKVPETKIVDAPRYEYRGLMVDVARNFQPVDQVLQLVDVMSQYKLNKLHLHLTDDEGWRIEIPNLEELTQMGGRRCHNLDERNCLQAYLGSGPAPSLPASGYYTTDDYKTILRYAAERHIQVIPEIDMPGHAHAAIKAMDARRRRLKHGVNRTQADSYMLTDDHDPSRYKSPQMFTDNAINPCLESTYQFVTHVVRALVDAHREIMPLQMFHMGGNEVAAGAWLNSSACTTLLSSNQDMASHKDLKEYFVKEVSRILQGQGVDMGAWDDGLMKSDGSAMAHGDLASGKVYAYAWNNVWEWGTAHRAHTLANAGIKVVMAQATHLYFDHPQEPDPEERGVYWAPRFTDTKKTFNFMPSDLYANAEVTRSGDPVSSALLCGENGMECVKLERPKNMVGIQGQLWSQVIRSKEQVDYMLFPRLLALAERAWHQPTWEVADDSSREAEREADWAAFANTLGYRELARLDRQGVMYRVPLPGASVANNQMVTNVPFPGLHVEYSADDGATWSDVTDPIPFLPGYSGLLRTRSASGGRYSRVVTVTHPVSSAVTAHGVLSLRVYLSAAILVTVASL